MKKKMWLVDLLSTTTKIQRKDGTSIPEAATVYYYFMDWIKTLSKMDHFYNIGKQLRGVRKGKTQPKLNNKINKLFLV